MNWKELFMRKLEQSVPGACWVEIVRARDKDGFRNDIYFLEGHAAVFFITGGLRERWAFFRGMVRLEQGKPAEVDAGAYVMASFSGNAIEMKEIGPDMFEITIRDAIYRLRILSNAESTAMEEAVRVACEEGSAGV